MKNGILAFSFLIASSVPAVVSAAEMPTFSPGSIQAVETLPPVTVDPMGWYCEIWPQLCNYN